MQVEWLVFWVLAALFGCLVAARTLRRTHGGRWIAYGVLFCAVGIFASRAHAWYSGTYKHFESTRAMLAASPQEGRPGGYVSSAKCRACHPSQYESWHRSYHRTMTQYASPEAIVAAFDGVVLELSGQTYKLERKGDEFWVDLEDPDWHLDWQIARQSKTHPRPREPQPARVKRRIGMLTGSHNMQVFWIPSRYGNQQIIFPFTWIIPDQRWAPFRDTFLRDPKALDHLNIWNVNCIQCHTTGGMPLPDPQTGVLATRTGEIGIACECCHGPAEAHVKANQSPTRRYWLHSAEKSTDSTIVNPARLPPDRSSQVCGQCHGIKWIDNKEDWKQNGFRFRPGDDINQTTPVIRPNDLDSLARHMGLKSVPGTRPADFLLDNSYWSDGMVRVSGREYSGLVESACHQKGGLSCVHCHSLHQSDPNDQLAARMETNEACLQCHKEYREKIEAHTRHKPESSGSKCYNCHMPHTTYGLLKAIHSHWIDVPRAETSVATGRPNACNLCHLDKSIGWSAQRLAEWTGGPRMTLTEDEEKISGAVSWILRGDAGQRALLAWHFGWDDAKTASGDSWLAPYLAVLLDDPYSAVRYIAQRSLRSLPGFGSFSYDFIAPEEERARARSRATDVWKAESGRLSAKLGPQVLLQADGSIDEVKLQSLLHQRDNRSIDLQE